MANFVVEFPLRTLKYQEDILNRRFEIGRQIYNALVNVTQKRYKEMVKTKRYRALLSSLTGNKKLDKEIWKQISNICKQYGMSEYSFHKDVKLMQKHFKENIDSFTAQKIATELWKSYDDFFYGNGKKVYYKRYGELNSLEGKSNTSGIRFKDDTILWNGLEIPVVIDYDNYYEYQAIQSQICYNRIVRKYVRNKYKYYVQIVFKGNPPLKVDIETGEIKHYIGNGDVGLDIGTRTIAISSQSDVKILELADRIQNIENQKQKLLRKMDRSRRATNPDNYNEDGTIKKQGNKKVRWNKSNHYIKYQNELKELYRKQADIRKYQHECLANYIISLGNKVYVEKMNFAGLQKRAKNTEKNDKGKFKRKKRFGKSLANKAPSMLLNIINRKLGYYGEKLIEINTLEAKASQFNHFDGTYTKKSLSQRWNDFDGIRIQRDMYSAFRIMNISDDLKSFDIDKCNERFENFYQLHNLEVTRLTGKKNLSSIAI
ncbi:MAG: transposase [Sharpea porci]|uniref:transposase n=1 Tax=Sharpea porci TaxID=2652286 RepID=UPI00240A29FD|nr:transposase [Sharpea porci]MDD6711338.1 transposase [Sharpea porci]